MKSTSQRPIEIPEDIAARCDGSEQFEKFDKLFRAVIAVPKAEIEKREDEWKRQHGKQSKTKDVWKIKMNDSEPHLLSFVVRMYPAQPDGTQNELALEAENAKATLIAAMTHFRSEEWRRQENGFEVRDCDGKTVLNAAFPD